MINLLLNHTSGSSIIRSFIVRAYQFLFFLVLLIPPQTNYADSVQGLKANYWNYSIIGNNYTFPTSTPDLTRIDETVNFSWRRSSPDTSIINRDHFAARWEGIVTPTETGNYIFSTLSDDGVRLWVNNRLIIDNWTAHGPTWDSGITLSLEANTQYNIKMEFFEHGGGATAKLHWQTPSNSTRTTIPKEVLSPESYLALKSVDNLADCEITNRLLVNFNANLQSGTASNGAERIDNYSISSSSSAR